MRLGLRAACRRFGLAVRPPQNNKPHPTPKITLLIIAAALLIAIAPALQPLLIYDRDQILAGQFWRLFTGHWVHLSTRHLILDVCSLAILASILETRNQLAFENFILIVPWLISADSLIFAPDMQRYYGLSALATAAWTFLAAQILFEQKSPWIPLAMFAAAAAKILFELHTATSLFVPFNTPEIRIAVTSHLAAALLGPFFARRPKTGLVNFLSAFPAKIPRVPR